MRHYVRLERPDLDHFRSCCHSTGVVPSATLVNLTVAAQRATPERRRQDDRPEGRLPSVNAAAAARHPRGAAEGHVNLEEYAMLPRPPRLWGLAVAGLALLGCGQNAFLNPQQTPALGQQPPAYMSQLQELQRRVSELDLSNRDLHTKLAQTEQQAKVFRDQTELLQRQLRDTANQLRDTQLARQEAEKHMQTLQASTRRQGGAMITANSSVRQSLGTIDIEGVEVRQDQDVIRIELPADDLFAPGTVQLLPAAYSHLDKIADAVIRNYPRQRIAVEGHTDSAPEFSANPTTNHQLASLQALAVFDLLTRRNRLPARQLFIVGLGANHPRASNATEAGRAKNRRIELVIYPQTLD